jgi:NADH-quinone oxidoreductase subunit N
MTYYMFTYLFIVTGVFGVLIALRGQEPSGGFLNDFSGLRRRSPVTALLLIIFVLSLAGAPPTAGFFARYFIFRALLETGHRYIAWFVALSSLPLAYSYLRIAVRMARQQIRNRSRGGCVWRPGSECIRDLRICFAGGGAVF